MRFTVIGLFAVLSASLGHVAVDSCSRWPERTWPERLARLLSFGR